MPSLSTANSVPVFEGEATYGVTEGYEGWVGRSSDARWRGAPERVPNSAAPVRPCRTCTTEERGSAWQPVAQRLHDRAGRDQPLAHRGDDLVRSRAVAVDADGLDPRVDRLAGDRAHLALQRHADRLLGRLRGVGDQRVLAELAGDQLPVAGVDPIGEALCRNAQALHLARLRVVLGHGHGHEDDLRIELEDLLRGGPRERQVLLEHVVLDAVRLDVLHAGAGGLGEGGERPDLVAVVVLQLGGGDVHAAPAEA